MINFAALVLRPAMVLFGQPVTVTPVTSQPGAPAYPARGSYSFKPVQIALEDGTYHSTNQPALGVMLSDFPAAPKQGDTLVRSPGAPCVPGALPDGTYEITDVVPDGQGGADLVLRNTSV